jgi:hypothetical protein
MSEARMAHLWLWEFKPGSAAQIAPEHVMPLALPFDGVTPLLLHMVSDPFKLGYASIERKVLIESLELPREGALLIAPSPVSVTLQPCRRALQEIPTAFL